MGKILLCELDLASMAYENFTIDAVRHELNIEVTDAPSLFPQVAPIPASDVLPAALQRGIPLGNAIGTEKAKSEFIIAPILAEVKAMARRPLSLFSGIRFDVDASRGLNGYCDFLLSASASQHSLSAPIITIVEAKSGIITAGLGQCMAEMVAAQLYNRNERGLEGPVFGCVTSGSVWKFLKLDGSQISIDSVEYYLDQLPTLLGIFQAIVEQATG